jgi:hypothetical protein
MGGSARVARPFRGEKITLTGSLTTVTRFGYRLET